MLDFLKECGLTYIEIEYLKNNLDSNIQNNLSLLRNNVIENLNYYDSIGVENIVRILILRPDLVLTTKQTIENNVNLLGRKLFVSIMNSSIEDLILVGV